MMNIIYIINGVNASAKHVRDFFESLFVFPRGQAHSRRTTHAATPCPLDMTVSPPVMSASHVEDSRTVVFGRPLLKDRNEEEMQIRKMQSGFSLAQLQEKCPDVSYDMIRKVLKDLKIAGRIKAEGRGVSAQWHKKGNTL
jgi:hypothetical protein